MKTQIIKLSYGETHLLGLLDSTGVRLALTPVYAETPGEDSLLFFSGKPSRSPAEQTEFVASRLPKLVAQVYARYGTIPALYLRWTAREGEIPVVAWLAPWTAIGVPWTSEDAAGWVLSAWHDEGVSVTLADVARSAHEIIARFRPLLAQSVEALCEIAQGIPVVGEA